MTDLGTLGGSNSSTVFRLNESGEIAGASDTLATDPWQENFCGFGTPVTCLPFVWKNGTMAALPTLGGNNAVANEINNRGQITGVSENTTQDPSCTVPLIFQFKPVLWDNGQIRELPTFPGDPDGYALGINDNGQVVGNSGTCTNPFLHALLWRNDSVTDLGNLGGAFNNAAIEVNNQGQVVGQSDVTGDATYHAFLWQGGVMTDLGTLPGDMGSIPDAIDNKGHVVGASFDASGNLRAFLWQDGVMTDLNNLIPTDSPLYLIEATHVITSSGKIAGYALVISTGEIHAFVANPIHGEAAGQSAVPVAPDETTQRPKIALPENTRKLVARRLLVGRFKRGLTSPE